MNEWMSRWYWPQGPIGCRAVVIRSIGLVAIVPRVWAFNVINGFSPPPKSCRRPAGSPSILRRSTTSRRRLEQPDPTDRLTLFPRGTYRFSQLNGFSSRPRWRLLQQQWTMMIIMMFVFNILISLCVRTLFFARRPSLTLRVWWNGTSWSDH